MDKNGPSSELLGSSKDGEQLFATIQASATNQDPASSAAPSKLSGQRRSRSPARYEGIDASYLTKPQPDHVEATPRQPVSSGKLGFDPKNGTSSLRSGHLFKTIIPSDPRHSQNRRPDGTAFPVAVGFCVRGCGTHCNQNPIDRFCPENPSVTFKNNQMLMTYVFASPTEE